MLKKRLLIAFAIVAVLGAGCGDDKKDKDSASPTTASTAAGAPTGPQTYQVVVDAPSTLHSENLAVGLYFPKTLAVRPGDTVTFENRGVSDPHTITFGVKADRSDSPALIINAGSGNPAVFGPCFTAGPPKTDLTSCTPAASGPPEFSGTGFWNSGAILPTSVPAEAGPKTVTLKVAASTAPGTYPYMCLLHRYMESTLKVVASDSERQSPAQVATTADKELGDAKALAIAAVPKPPETPATADTVAVAASWGDNTFGVNQFSPETVSVKVGQKVTWTDHSSWLPHTISFNPPFASEAEPHALAPTGAKDGSKFPGGVAHSGIFGPSPPLPTDKFSLVFTKAGKYPYRCLLHPGMAGTVEVS